MRWIFLFCIQMKAYLSKKIYLFTQIPRNAPQERLEEYIFCLEKNLGNPLIDKIYLINSFLPITTSSKLLQINGHEDLAISSGLKIANNISQLAEKGEYTVAIISNADIYFDDTLSFLQPTFKSPIFLSRYEKTLYFGPLYIGNQCELESFIGSHDVFAFKLPFPPFLMEAVDFQLGTPGMEARMIYELDMLGLKVLNPCKSVQTWHVHRQRRFGEYRFPVVNTKNRSMLSFPF
jgi:hypothetical protein